MGKVSVLRAVWDLATLVVALPIVAVLLPFRLLAGYLYHSVLDRVLASRKARIGHVSLLRSAGELASDLRRGVYSSREAVLASTVHATHVQKHVAAICENRFAEALVDAANVQDGRPFSGVPCSIKECFAVSGTFCQSSGIATRCKKRTEADATVVARLRAAGCIPIANTNTSEICMWYESSNAPWGRTRNPYDLRRIVGGSSGGEACLVSAGAVPVGLGSDIGGSIRMPAGFNGVFGHKPTGGLVPSTGQHPATPYSFLVTGPITRHACDLWPTLALIAGSDGQDRACVDIKLAQVALPLPAGAEAPVAVLGGGSSGGAGAAGQGPERDDRLPTGRYLQPQPTARPPANTTTVTAPPDTIPDGAITDWGSVTVYTIGDMRACAPGLTTPVQPAVAAAVDAAAAALVSRMGCKGVLDLTAAVPELKQGLRDGFEVWGAVLAEAEDNPSFADLMNHSHGRTLWLGWEIVKWSVGLSGSTLPALILALIEQAPKVLMPGRHKELLRMHAVLKEKVHSVLASTNGILVYPVHPTVAPLHDVPLLRPLNVAYTAFWNVLDVPSTVAPMGLESRYDTTGSRVPGTGLPVAVQLVGARGFDRLTIAAAEALELTGVAGWVPPPLLELPQPWVGIAGRLRQRGQEQGSAGGTSRHVSAAAAISSGGDADVLPVDSAGSGSDGLRQRQ